MVDGFGKMLGLIFAGIVSFSALNAFLFNLGYLERGDYMLANALLIVVIYFAYLTYEIQKIKEKISLTPKKKKK